MSHKNSPAHEHDKMLDIERGKHNDYFWLQVPNVVGIQVLEKFPDILQRYSLVIASFDGGPLELTEQEKEHGFTLQGNLVICPACITCSEVPEGGGNEWYFFDGALSQQLGSIERFANLALFHLAEDNRITAEQASFWSQLETLRARIYICDTNLLLLATYDLDFFERACSVLPKLSDN